MDLQGMWDVDQRLQQDLAVRQMQVHPTTTLGHSCCAMLCEASALHPGSR